MFGPLATSKAATKARRLARNAGSFGHGLEALEGRQLLASDLGVRWAENVDEFPSRIIPGTRILAPIEVINNGPTFASGTVDIRFYLSTDQSLDTSVDRQLRAYTNQPLDLPVYNGVPDNIGTFVGDLSVPADLASASYYIIVRIVPSSEIGDFTQSNNTASTEDKFPVGRFGNVDGLNNAVTTLIDADGTAVTFALTGGGSGNVQLTDAGFVITLTGTGINSNFAIAANDGGDDRFTIASVNITGSLASLNAPAGKLIGAFTNTGGLGAVTLGDVTGPVTITIPETTLQPRFSLGVVRDLSITSAVAITSLAASSWTNTGANRASINAPWVGPVTITGDLGVNFNLSGREGNVPTLGAVNVGGFLRPSSWVVRGIGSTIRAQATTAAFVATFEKRITSITTTLAMRGLITARAFQAINVGTNLAGARILAGAFLGSDAALGGTGGNADSFLNGVINAISIGGNVTVSTVGAGLDPADGILRNGNDRIVAGKQSTIGAITVNGTVASGSRFHTNVYSGPITINGQSIDWRTDGRFVLATPAPVPQLESATVNGGVATITFTVTSSTLMRLVGVMGNSLTLVPQSSGAPATNVALSSVRFVVGALQTKVRVVFTANVTAGVDYDLNIVADTIRDNRNYAVPAGTIGVLEA